MAVDEQGTDNRRSAEGRSFLDQWWLRLRVPSRRPAVARVHDQARPDWLEVSHVSRTPVTASWLVRHLLTIGLVHAVVLLTTYFLLLLGDALFTSYAIVLRDAVFVSYVAQLGWLQRMASDVKASIAFVVALSALLQMLLLVWRAATR